MKLLQKLLQRKPWVREHPTSTPGVTILEMNDGVGHDFEIIYDKQLAFRTFQTPDGFGGTIDIIQYPMQPQPPSWRDMHLIPYDKL